MIAKLDNFLVDPVLKVPLNIENDCVPLQIMTSSKASHLLEFEMDMDQEGKSELFSKKEDGRGEVQDAVDYVLNLKNSHRLIILGHAASGKTFVSKLLMIKMADQALIELDLSQDTFPIIPIFVSISSICQIDQDLPFEIQCIRGLNIFLKSFKKSLDSKKKKKKILK